MSKKPLDSSKKTKRKHNGDSEEETVTKKIKKSSKIVSKENQESSEIQLAWKDHELLAEKNQLPNAIAKNVVNLFNEDFTIPFIARYRKNLIGGMLPEDLRDAKDTYEEINQLKTKIKTVVKNVGNLGKLSGNLQQSILSVRSLEELEHVYAPFAPSNKRSLAERAKELGLETPALNLLYNKKEVNLNDFVGIDELKDVKQVELGVVHIIAAVIAADNELLNYLRELRTTVQFTVKTKKSTSKNADEKEVSKFENYFHFVKPVKYLKPHQILAINRGENHKILSVKIVVPDVVFNRIEEFCRKKWPPNRNSRQIINEAIKDSYNRLIQPLLIRKIREDLKQKAEKASYEVFSKNLKQLLLSTPIKGKPILAIDPGYSNGCKLALISATGALLSHNTIFPFKKTDKKAENILKTMLETHNCNLIALGNGTACRQVEQWLNDRIKHHHFAPLDVNYTIVNEDGASIYSCSPEAKKEFPHLDVNIISAVSLARRIQDPLSELVKVEPKHLGIGMYQHDLKAKRLEIVLDEIVSECVSFVGVDLNTTSECLLRHVSGLTAKRAQQIIKHRERIGFFGNRQQLLDVKGIGPKVYQQCAGFLRIAPISEEQNDFYGVENRTKLDATYIHPESYELTEKLLKKFQLNVKSIGECSFCAAIKQQLKHVKELSEEFNSTEETIQFILESLTKPIHYDMRNESVNVPLFKKHLTSLYDLKCNDHLTGCVKNVTHFGCFVDVGVETNGLIHCTHSNGLDLQIGDKVEVVVLNVDVYKKRLSLKAAKKY